MKGAFKFAVIGEGLTGLALLTLPNLVGWLLLGVEFTGVGIPAARVAGIALIGLSVACLPGLALAGMLIYSALATLYLGYLAFAGAFTAFCCGRPFCCMLCSHCFSPGRASRHKRTHRTDSPRPILLTFPWAAEAPPPP